MGPWLMKSSQSNFNLRLPGSYLARSYLIATVMKKITSSKFSKGRRCFKSPDPMAGKFHDPQAVLEDGGLNATTLEDTVFEQDTVELEHDNDEVTPLYPLGPSSPSNPFRPFSPPSDATSDVSPPWTPNLHPCQAPLFVSYNACRHDYTRSDERVCYDGSSSDCSPCPSCNPRNVCSPGCFSPKRCLRHYPFTFGCNVCVDSGWCPPPPPRPEPNTRIYQSGM